MGDQFAGATLLAVGQSSNATIFSYFATLQKPWQRVIGAVGLWSSSEKHTLQRGVLDNFSCMVENMDPGCGECLSNCCKLQVGFLVAFPPANG